MKSLKFSVFLSLIFLIIGMSVFSSSAFSEEFQQFNDWQVVKSDNDLYAVTGGSGGALLTLTSDPRTNVYVWSIKQTSLKFECEESGITVVIKTDTGSVDNTEVACLDIENNILFFFLNSDVVFRTVQQANATRVIFDITKKNTPPILSRIFAARRV